jgi:aryl-alcohol dehydrogenase-like predicted oxidoreductase
MIGHESEDGLERKDSDSLQEDILKHKSILKVPSLHVVYLDPPSDSETYFQIIETLVENIRNKNINSYAFRNWTADEIRTAIHYADTSGVPRPSAIITTEFSSAIPKTPLWNGYIPFDTSLREAAIELNLTVWAWVSDINQPLFIPVNERSWFLTADRMERWLTDENEYIVRKLSDMAISKGLTLRQVNAESLLHQPFRVIGIISKDATNLGDLDEFYDIAGI